MKADGLKEVLFLYYVGHEVLVISCMGLAETTNSWDQSDNSRVKRADDSTFSLFGPFNYKLQAASTTKISIYIYKYIYMCVCVCV